ncbi:magnesium transporter CorA family protein [Candidatus Woesearchaeota archaeon]|nr:magnesium transporter CorA family protein [Candidatus Woesearchaeota archaeon]
MITYLVFSEGRVKRGKNLNYPLPTKDSYMFIFLTRPTEQETKKVVEDFHLNPEPLNTYHKATHSRRYITKPFQFVMRTTFLENGTIGYANILFVLMNRVLVVSTSRPSEFYDAIVEDIARTFIKTKVRSVGHILYNFLQEDVDENYEVLGKLEQKIKNVETRASQIRQKEISVRVDDILALKSQLFRLSRQFWATTRVISLIRIGVAQIDIDRESERMLGDVHETFLHQIDVAAALKEMVSDALTVYQAALSNISAMTSNELNIVVKKLTSYGALLLIPTVIASIYGMNVNLPFAHWQYGFYVIAGVMTALTALAFLRFMKNDWL